ncbi:TetR/AcrR family transcriptional regulator [Actinomadura rupiterrae]|uniref:TetR/AcrR family transcriptional regulator n=1 Tax=Actinomadura rupiterrae TaxID=559627 RepID=UPI0020A4A06D|nr:TetR/AcrR family transcriptional regulator [Actinomadura rupiterrae]MCP2335133.1 AcrR family transcriptional regulator [Actinomadura rupiterrae]
MTSTGRPEKRRAIMDGARKVFGRDGYTRAGMDAIADEAKVSKRTIYNHFADKEHLFQAVAVEGGQQVTDAVKHLMDLHLLKILDLEEDLLAFSRDRAATITGFPDHFALVRALEAEVTRIPRPVLDRWIAAGPQTAHERLAPYLARIAERGLLDLPDPVTAALHFNQLTVAVIIQRTFYGALPLPAEETERLLRDGVRAFLRAYRPASP